MKNRKKTFEIALLGLLLALEFVFAYVKIPMASGLCITFNMVPVAIAAIAMGISGGAIVGGIFGLLSFSTCFGWFGGDAFGALLLNMNPFYTFVLCVVTRVMVGALAAAIHKLISKWVDVRICYMITGLLTALLNTILFMSALVLLFGITGILTPMNVLLYELIWMVPGLLITEWTRSI